VLTSTLTKKIIDIVQGLTDQLEELHTNQVYAAISSGVIEGTPEDLGTVRFSCSYFSQIQFTEGYLYMLKNNQSTDGYEKYVYNPAQLTLVLDIPRIGQIGAVVSDVNPKSGKFDRSDVKVRIDGPEGTLWYNEANLIIDKLPALIKLTDTDTSFKLVDM
jgi:hypothetical protein